MRSVRRASGLVQTPQWRPTPPLTRSPYTMRLLATHPDCIAPTQLPDYGKDSYSPHRITEPRIAAKAVEVWIDD
jgi:hypothetical protein